MENHDSPEAVAKRAFQEDPVVMYLIVREEIEMTRGKLGAQTGHATQMMQLQHQFTMLSRFAPGLFPRILSESQMLMFDEWLATSFRKVTLRASDKEWAKLKELYQKPEAVIVVDAGLTELEPGTETVMALLPMKKSERPKLVKRLQALNE